ncbi:MAG: 6-carboxytetrahydropterin synthase [Bryobacteraceae bacterium]|nr:6-carboxytetrahydropterin synthase [Bryobacteraceae bacterium]
MKITRRIEFSSSHVCALAGRSEAENRALYGAAANPHGHGHNYVLEVTIAGQPDPVTGMIVDLKEVKEILNQEVVQPFDHRHLNHEVPPFDRIVPTTENIALEIWRRLAPHFSGAKGRLDLVKLYETEDLYVEYAGEPA